MDRELKVGNYVRFEVTEDIIGEGEILGKASNGIIPAANMWIISLSRRETDYLMGLNWKAMVVQECHLEKIRD